MTTDTGQGARPRSIPRVEDTVTYPRTTTDAATTGALIVLPEGNMRWRWRRDHRDRLLRVLSRAELRAQWATIASAKAGRALGRWGRADHLAQHDAAVLTSTGPASPELDAERDAAGERVYMVGTPMWWADQHVSIDTPCPLRPPTAAAHRWSEMDPVCIYCAVVIGTPAPVDRAVLADQVWEAQMRAYGLRRDQVAGAIDALGDLIDTRRGAATPTARRRATAVRPEPEAPHVQMVRGCRHLYSGLDPVCEHCGAIAGEVEAVTRRDLAHDVWTCVGRDYGLEVEQIESAMHELRDLVNTHRGAIMPRVRAGLAPTAPQHGGQR